MALADRSIAARAWACRRRLTIALPASVVAGITVLLQTVAAAPAVAQSDPNPIGAQPQPPVPGGPAGLLVGAAGGALGGIARDLVDGTTAGILAAVTGWFTDAARWVLEQIAGYLAGVTSPDLTAGWWVGEYNRMLALSIMVAAAMLLLALMGAAARGSWDGLVQAVAVDVPIAAVAGGVGPVLVQYLIELADQVAAGFGGAIPRHVGESLFGLTRWFVAIQGAPDGLRMPGLMVVLLALATILAGLIILLELLLRANAIYFLALLIPLVYAARIWPAARAMARKVVQITGAIIAAKPVIMLALSVGASMMGSLQGPGRDTAQEFGFATAGVIFLLLAALAPWAVLALLPPVEGEASAAARQRASVTGLPRSGLQAGYTAAYFGQMVSYRRQAQARQAAGSTPAGTSGQTATGAAGAAGAAAAATGAARAAGRAAQQPAVRQRRQAAAVNPTESSTRRAESVNRAARAPIDARQRAGRARRPPPPLPPETWLG